MVSKLSKDSINKIICDRCKENEEKSKANDEKFKNDLINDFSESKNRLNKPDVIKSTTKNIQSRVNLVNKNYNVVPSTKTTPVITNETKQLESGGSVINKKAEVHKSSPHTVQNPAMFPYAGPSSYLPFQYSHFNPNMNYLPSPSNQIPQAPQSNFYQGYNQLPQ